MHPGWRDAPGAPEVGSGNTLGLQVPFPSQQEAQELWGGSLLPAGVQGHFSREVGS